MWQSSGGGQGGAQGVGVVTRKVSLGCTVGPEPASSQHMVLPPKPDINWRCLALPPPQNVSPKGTDVKSL